MILLRRFVLILCIAFWQGGFMFYGGVVVPVGASVLGSETEQGFITQAVTNYLNVAGAVCVIVWGVALRFDGPPASRTARAGWSLWSLIVVALGIQIGLHIVMDRWLDTASRTIIDERKFIQFHEAYITTSTVQWLLCLALLGLTLVAWRNEAEGKSRSTAPIR
jgi:hypothetical protein